MKIFNASEIYQFAVRIEDNGEMIYKKFSKTLKDKEAGDLFIYLADEEVKHRRIFEEMLAPLEKYEPAESYPGEYFTYLRSYADGVVFARDRMEKERTGVTEFLSAADFGLRRETDSIMFYQEMKGAVSNDQKASIEKVIEEERKHFLKIYELKQKRSKESGSF
ncbi:MAG TPA: ferritin family protein [bacterium]|nr:ferritin family protein [bacterium]